MIPRSGEVRSRLMILSNWRGSATRNCLSKRLIIWHDRTPPQKTALDAFQQISAIDAWIATQDIEVTRPDAIRRRVELGLKAKKYVSPVHHGHYSAIVATIAILFSFGSLYVSKLSYDHREGRARTQQQDACNRCTNTPRKKPLILASAASRIEPTTNSARSVKPLGP